MAHRRPRDGIEHPDMSEQFPGQIPGQDPRNDPRGQSPVGLPSESIGAPRPPHQFRKGLRAALPIVLGLGLGGLYIANSTARVLFILAYAALAWFYFIRLIVRRLRIRRTRLRPPSRRS